MNLRDLTLFAVIITAVMMTAGCANSSARYQPIVDGNVSMDYYSDVQACQQLATRRTFTNGDVKSEAVAGAVTGILIGAIEQGTEGAIAGAVVGSALGGGSTAWDTREERKKIVIECMKGRGHRVVG